MQRFICERIKSLGTISSIAKAVEGVFRVFTFLFTVWEEFLKNTASASNELRSGTNIIKFVEKILKI